MHDTYLLNKIAQSLKELCQEYKLKKIEAFTLVVNHHSHVNEESLREHLEIHSKECIGDALRIKLQREDIEEQTAIIHSLQGETFEL
ncbi:hypothetical protein [Geosporobacter ferrireducens]|uniref:Hydrogenase nickel incorporation protein HypA n=1 Tax=Geosporobacter ferrireducens TaxID=1424294 RepID=A0A1D8GEV3_9FIRM|nr:hypothetical protein [Geosporobacter ferrireducens]AOT69425.1 hypothetical protein Gferi_07465 [Geosporobacter ferrireducens]MTI56537.1 hypothetical protein [Geosporobacter ferrireducens]